MSDREFLELAAKAARIEVWWNGITYFILKTGVATHEWNPLANDGDAFRLAVKLRLDIELHALADGDFRRVVVTWADFDADSYIEQDNEFGDAFDDAHLVRRAIVRAAAEIGRGMTKPVDSGLPEDNYYKTQAEAERKDD